ncbi:MAG: LysR family transcriptional regulator [Bdellovibrionaceae bacterium]|nr:LysR family transcriptional regulator [Pseudobdellovibrionaceae bacterium]MDW8190053.1 LysR family transcriptional regulator [Pseudobdellovibrionaceae bacterium]
MLNIQQLQSFVTVVAEGSMTEAANKLYLTQPAISQQIRNLEEELGVELLVRGSRIVKPTLHGELLYEQARRILQQVAQTEAAMKRLSSDLSGHLRVGTLNSLGVQMVSPVVGRLLKFNPKISLEVDFDSELNLIEKFKKDLLDVVIISELDLPNLGSVEKKMLLKEELVLVASGRDTEIPRQISLKELNMRPLMWLTGEFLDFEGKLKNALVQNLGSYVIAFKTSNVGTLKRVIESGLGWGFVPSVSVTKQIRSGRLTQIFVSDFSYRINFYYCRNPQLKNEQKLLSDALFIALENLERG